MKTSNPFLLARQYDTGERSGPGPKTRARAYTRLLLVSDYFLDVTDQDVSRNLVDRQLTADDRLRTVLGDRVTVGRLGVRERVDRVPVQTRVMHELGRRVIAVRTRRGGSCSEHIGRQLVVASQRRTRGAAIRRERNAHVGRVGAELLSVNTDVRDEARSQSDGCTLLATR